MKTSRLFLTLVAALVLAAIGFVALHGVPVQAQGGASGPGVILFSSNRSGNYEIYLLDPGTGLATQLTNNPANDIDPVWSGDGKWIAFASDRDGDYELYIMNADGSGLRQLTNNQAQDVQPRWQPGDQWIVYNSNVNGQFDVYAISADGAIVRQLTNDPADERGPVTGAAGPVVPPGNTGGNTGPLVVTATAFATPVPDAVVSSYNLNVRENPGEGAKILMAIPRDTPLKVVGRFFDNSWVQVLTPTNVTGWVYAPLLTININLANVPVVNAIFISPPPTMTPTPAVTPTLAVIIEFYSDRGKINSGECAIISWHVEGIKAVYYQNNGVVGQGSSKECPTVTTTYNLKVIRLDGTEDNRYLTIEVKP